MPSTSTHLLKVPEHIAIIMDGNGRWSQQQGVKTIQGHKAGAEAARKIGKKAHELGIKYLTLYTFSTENWLRPKLWINDLLALLKHYLTNEINELVQNNIRFHVIGNRQEFDDNMISLIENLELKTQKNTGLNLILALNYGGRADITQATKSIAQQVLDKKIEIDSITSQLISKNLYTSAFPDPDLFIRTSGEMRISNFLLWQMAYSEFIFVDKFWPDFNTNDFEAAILEFNKRDRRYGY